MEKHVYENEEACAAAISVLRVYYEGAALVQIKSEAKASSQGDGSGILGVLEIAESDFATGLAEARTVEDKKSVIGELNAVLVYLDKLKPQCETKVPSDADIKAMVCQRSCRKTSSARDQWRPLETLPAPSAVMSTM